MESFLTSGGYEGALQSQKRRQTPRLGWAARWFASLWRTWRTKTELLELVLGCLYHARLDFGTGRLNLPQHPADWWQPGVDPISLAELD